MKEGLASISFPSFYLYYFSYLSFIKESDSIYSVSKNKINIYIVFENKKVIAVKLKILFKIRDVYSKMKINTEKYRKIDFYKKIKI